MYTVLPAGLTRIFLPILAFSASRSVTSGFAFDFEVVVDVDDPDDGFDELPHAASDSTAAAVMNTEMTCQRFTGSSVSRDRTHKLNQLTPRGVSIPETRTRGDGEP